MPGRRRPLIGTLQPLQVRILHDGRRRGGPRRAGAERQDGEHGGGGALAAAAQAMDLAVQQARPGGSALLTSASRSCPHESGRGCTCTAQHRDRGGGGGPYIAAGAISTPPPGKAAKAPLLVELPFTQACAAKRGSGDARAMAHSTPPQVQTGARHPASAPLHQPSRPHAACTSSQFEMPSRKVSSSSFSAGHTRPGE